MKPLLSNLCNLYIKRLPFMSFDTITVVSLICNGDCSEPPLLFFVSFVTVILSYPLLLPPIHFLSFPSLSLAHASEIPRTLIAISGNEHQWGETILVHFIREPG